MISRAILAAIIIPFLVASCGPASVPLPGNRNKWLDNWLNAPTCEPPCWENIEPGKTQFAQAPGLLAQIPEVEIAERSETSLEWTIDQTDSGWITARDGLVDSVVLNIAKGEDVSLDELQNRYGAPADFVMNSCEDGYCDVGLTYPGRGMVIELLLENRPDRPAAVAVSASSHIGRIYLFGDLDIYRTLVPTSIGKSVIWRGYGDYP